MTENLIFCETCGESVDISKYKAHLRHAHLPKKEFSCEICFKKFSSKFFFLIKAILIN